jgi:hypothetical protein
MCLFQCKQKCKSFINTLYTMLIFHVLMSKNHCLQMKLLAFDTFSLIANIDCNTFCCVLHYVSTEELLFKVSSKCTVSSHESVSKIFRTDAVKIINLTTKPIGYHHPRSSSLPHVDTGPTNSSIFGTLLGSFFRSECQALSAIQPDLHNGMKQVSFQLQFHFWK